ncbi:uncharacterized protein LOC128208010 isoform X2 [Mya arenaria]|uniref:uncharacterized protein LOC128208010 isoform X2 n=1 Tax=Mya arenaria TaxID=6604 RepID=UPI0022E2615D|nr:uncharacterized protein LOC128208010 isoform X2 [Mya arenaria]
MDPNKNETVNPRSAVNQVMGLYIIVAFTIASSWLLGAFNFSFLWVFGLIFALFIVWKSRLRNTVERNLAWHKEQFHRKRALRQEETAEWLNFIVNRWWVFSSVSIEDLVKRRINERLVTVKPSFIGHLEVIGFTFGDITPSFRSIKAFECSDGVPGFKPACWSNIAQPPAGLHKMSTFQIVLEADMSSRCDEFRMVFRARAGGERVGLHFDVAVEELQVKGTLQAVLHMSMEVPFPHITKATISFNDTPEVWFNVTVLKALQLMEIPLIKSWIHINVMEGITRALVDPGKIDIPFSKAGPVSALQVFPHVKQELAQGVLTIQIKGTPSEDSGEDIHYTRLRLGKCKRQTLELPATQAWEDCCSFFVFNLVKEKLNVKHKCKRLLTTVTLEQHDLELSSFPFTITKQLSHEIKNKDGSKLNLVMDYSPLPPINLDEEEAVNVLQRSGVLFVCVHCANNVIASDKTGSSDPYCVVFCDRRRILTTPYLAQTRNPKWESHAELFVKDFSQCNLSFYVFDWDGTNKLDNDFLGSAHHVMSEKEPYVLKKALTLGYNKQGLGHLDDPGLGQIVVSVIFRPVSSVGRSERYRLTSTDSANNNEFLYVEDMVSPGTMTHYEHVERTKPESCDPNEPEGGGKKLSKQQSSQSNDEFMRDKVFVDLTLVQAKELIAADTNGYSDPFCEIWMRDTKLFSSSVKKKTLSPMWNESVALQVTEDCGMLEIQVFDKDLITRNDFLGKVMLTLDDLKELSLKGTDDWFPLKHTKSGQIQLRCSVTAAGNKPGKSMPSVSKQEQDANNSAKSQTDGTKPSTGRGMSIESDVFITPSENQKLKSTPDITRESDSQLRKRNSSSMINNKGDKASPVTSTPLKKDQNMEVGLKRSASDVNMDKRRRSTSNSLNSFAAFNDLNMSTVMADPTVDQVEPLDDDTVGDLDHTDSLGGRLFNVTGKILSIQGLKFNEGSIYCKVRVLQPNRRRLRLIFGNRVIAKSPLIKATQTIVNLPIDIDRGMGIHGDTLLKFDIKREGKEHLASRAYTIKTLFSGEGGEGDKVQKVLPLENNLQIEVYLQHTPVDSSSIRRHGSSRMSVGSRSFRK